MLRRPGVEEESGLAPAYREDPVLLALILVAAATSIAPLLLDLAGVIRMPYTLSFLTLPGCVFLLGLQIRSGRAGRARILRRLRVGTVAGLVGLVAYNGARWLAGAALSAHVSPFYSIHAFGTLITGRPGDSTLALAFGWAYHITNGVTFGIMYTLLAGPARWWYGLAWGLLLEVAMLLVYPASTVLRPPALAPFVAVSLISHALFGTVIGLVSQRFATAGTPAVAHAAEGP